MVDKLQNDIGNTIIPVDDPLPLVVLVDPEIMIEKQALQQGVFFQQASIYHSFEDNMAATINIKLSMLMDQSKIEEYSSDTHDLETL
jgi:hypothetical protein